MRFSTPNGPKTPEAIAFDPQETKTSGLEVGLRTFPFSPAVRGPFVIVLKANQQERSPKRHRWICLNAFPDSGKAGLVVLKGSQPETTKFGCSHSEMETKTGVMNVTVAIFVNSALDAWSPRVDLWKLQFRGSFGGFGPRRPPGIGSLAFAWFDRCFFSGLLNGRFGY